MTDDQSKKINEEKGQNVLTGIHASYTVSATQDGGTGEVDRLMIKHFLYTLAEVALSVASRKAGK